VAKQTKALALPSTETIIDEYKETGASPALLDLIQAADGGNRQALSDLRVVYAAVPELAECVSSWQWALEREIIGGTQPGIQETFAVQANRLRKRLAGDDPTPLEKLLVNRVVVDQLHALKVEHLLHAKLNGAPISLAQGEYHHKQAERAQRRVVRSLKALAEVRRLLRPTLQVNVADQQVNVAGDLKAR
jgi:hypothetical protein